VTEIKKPTKWGVLVLFTSISTLLCCALPILLVSLGMGAVVASLASSVPFLITLSQYKAWTFSMTAIILVSACWVLYRPGRVCPADPEYARLCNNAHKWNTRFFWIATTIWCIGSFAAFILPLLQE